MPARSLARLPLWELLEPRRLLAAGDLVITEFVARNDSGLRAADGSRPDWIEVYNPNPAPIDLAGWTIAAADVDGVAAAFTVPKSNPAATSVAAGGYRLVYADNVAPGVNAAGEIHANFKLDKAGGSLVLRRPDGTVTTAFDPYPEQATDVSYGPGPAVVVPGQSLGPDSPAKVAVAAAGPPADWTGVGFADSAWVSATAAVGFEDVPPAGSPPPALAAETENNGTPAAANDATTNFVAVPATAATFQLAVATASLGTTFDADFYRLGPFDPGDVLTVAALGRGALRPPFGTFAADTALTLFRGADPASLVEVRSVADADAGPSTDARIDRLTLQATDTYYVRVTADNGANGVYQLGATLEKAVGGTPPATTGSTTAEAESDDTAATATDVSASWRAVDYRSRTTGTIGPAADADYFKFAFSAGDRVTVDARAIAGASAASDGLPALASDLRVTLYAADGTTVLAADDGTGIRPPPEEQDATLTGLLAPATGTYYLKVAGHAAGGYTLDVDLSAAAPPPAPGLGPPIYGALVGTDLGPAMRDVSPSAYVRVPFVVAEPAAVTILTLGMRYEDGFVAYLNGQEVARANVPGSPGTVPSADATAAADRPDAAALTAQSFDLTPFKNLLTAGQNVLAIRGLNDSAADARFLLSPTLAYATLAQPGNQYFAAPTPGAANAGGSLGKLKDTHFSVDRGFYDAPVDVSITTASAGATIRYTLDGSEPTATAGAAYTGPIHVIRTTVLRAAAFRPGYTPSDVDTQTYLFTAGVAGQTVPSAGYPAAAYPPTWSAAYPADYAVDAGVVAADAAAFAAGLRDPAVPTLSVVLPPGSLFDPATGTYQNPQQEGGDWERAASVELLNPDGSPGFQVDAGLRIQGAAARDPANQPKHSFRLLFKSRYGDAKLDYPIFGPGSAGLDTVVLRATYNNSWTHPLAAQRRAADYLRDGWNRLTQAAMGQPAARQRFVQLYLNGLYWGLYDVTDRPEGSWAANELGGDADQYEVVNAGAAVGGPPTAGDPDGAAAAAADWAALFRVVDDPNIATAAGYANAVQNWIDPTNLADYILQNFYGGNVDWDLHNYYAYRDASPAAANKGWRFVAWDSERTLLDPAADVTGLDTPNSPTHLFRRLMTNPEFRLLLADRAHRALFNDGALTPVATGARYAAMRDQIRNAMVDESARWGDYRTGDGSAYGKADWTAETDRLLNSYFPARTGTLLARLRANDWYPSVAAPEFTGAFGGPVAEGERLAIDNPNADGTVYFTTDGSDPRQNGGPVVAGALAYDPADPPTLTAATRVRTRVLLDGVWSAITDATFTVRPTAAAVLAVVVNGGAPQRSMARSLKVTFDRPVVPEVAAFVVVGRGGAGAGAVVSAANPSGDGRTWVLSFAGPGVTGGSLDDGVYDLKVVAAKVHTGSPAGPGMAADSVTTFHRLFGDQDGNGTVNNADYVRFRAAFGASVGSPAYNAVFDFDANGTVNNLDYVRFRSRFGTAAPALG